jgi:hypothetical protein
VRAHPHLYEINTWPWLERLSVAGGRRVTLGTVPALEWDRLRALGFDLVYLMGMWQRSAISRQIARSEPRLFDAYDAGLPGWTPADIVGSPYSIREYVPDPRFGTWDDLRQARNAINSRGMQLILDFVPNHTAFDHPWIETDPHRYVTATLEQFRTAPQEFRVIESDPDGGPLYVACGRDPLYPPWTDVAQLNYFAADTREAMIAQLAAILEHCDGVRCDMAMLVLDDVFARTWGGLVGRSDPPGEFWAEVRAELPDAMLIGETYWDLQARLQQLGLSYTYDKRFYDALIAGDAISVRKRLEPDGGFHSRSVRFLENHDERRSHAVLGFTRLEAAAVMLATAPGIRMFYDGQLDGRLRYSPVQLGRWAEESEQPQITALYELLLGVSDDPVFHEGTWDVLDVRDGGDGSHVPLVALWWHSGPDIRLVVANIGKGPAQGFIQLPAALPPGNGPVTFEEQLRSATYRRDRAELQRQGLYVRLEPGRAHLFILDPSR